MSIADNARALRAPRRDRATGRRDERHLRIVEEPRGPGRRVLWTLLVSIVCLVLFGGVVFHVHLITGSQRIGDLEERAQQAQHTYDRLRVEVDGLSAPRRIVSRARSLGMVEAGERTWLAPGEGSPRIDPDTGTLPLRDYLDIKPYLGGTP